MAEVPADGTEDDLNNPPCIGPRHLFDVGVDADDLLRPDKAKLRVRFSIIKLAYKKARYNFLDLQGARTS